MLQEFENYLRQEKRYSGHTCLAYIQDIQQFSVFSGCMQLSDWQEQNTSTVRG
jgi:site-specific recombinase XerC